MWKILFDSVIGTSHSDSGLPCQDSSLVKELTIKDKPVLVALCADGAGSAKHADLGSRLACEIALREINSGLEESTDTDHPSRCDVINWIDTVRKEFDLESRTLDVDSRELACTLLGAIVGEDNAVFFQIGDGAIVSLNGAIVNCCVLRKRSSGGILEYSVLEGTSFEDECDLFVTA